MGKVYGKTYPKTYPKVYGKTNPPASLQDVLNLSPTAMYDVSVLSSLYQDSAKTTPVTASSDPVGAIEDLTGNQPDLLATANNNRATYTISGSSRYLNYDGIDDWYSAATKSGFNGLHDGTGGEYQGLFQFGNTAEPDDIYGIVSNSISTSEIGVQTWYDDRSAGSLNQASRYFVNNGTAAVLTTSGTNFTMSANTPYVHGFSCDDAENPIVRIWKDGAIATSAFKGNTPSTSNATRDMTIGNSITGGFTLLGRMYAIVFFDRKLTTAERAIVVSYLEGLK